jgi:hypothetical protein
MVSNVQGHWNQLLRFVLMGEKKYVLQELVAER